MRKIPNDFKKKRGGSEGDIRGAATAREAMEKSRYIRVIEREKVRRDDTLEYFLDTGFGSTF